MKAWRWLVALVALLLGPLLRRRRHGSDPDGRTVTASDPDRGAETVVALLLLIAALCAVGFIVAYGVFSPSALPNELLGGCIAAALAFIGLALAVLARRLVPSEELEDDYPSEHPQDQEEIARTVREGGSAITRKRLLIGAASTAGGALGLAALTPALSLGPLWYTAPLSRAPWRRGTRLVDPEGRPISAAQIEEEAFYTAFPEGANPQNIGSPVVVVRLAQSELRLPPGRAAWAPQGILAYSKICTHAGCAVALYRKPRFPVVEPKPALVCPCHYSTFDPATGASVTFGPAGRPLPQLPLMIDGAGYLRAAGDFSGPVGPSWWGSRLGPAR